MVVIHSAFILSAFVLIYYVQHVAIDSRSTKYYSVDDGVCLNFLSSREFIHTQCVCVMCVCYSFNLFIILSLFKYAKHRSKANQTIDGYSFRSGRLTLCGNLFLFHVKPWHRIKPECSKYKKKY